MIKATHEHGYFILTTEEINAKCDEAYKKGYEDAKKALKSSAERAKSATKVKDDEGNVYDLRLGVVDKDE